MNPDELIALSLALSIAVAATAGLTALGLERIIADLSVRDRVWACVLYLPGLPPLAVAAMLLTPPPVRPLQMSVATGPATAATAIDIGQLAAPLVMLTGLFFVFRLASLAMRGWRLNRLIALTEPAPLQARLAVASAANRLNVKSPIVRTGPTVTYALLAGLARPILILPLTVAEDPYIPGARDVIRHELAHLKRGDHRAVWFEEAAVAVLAINPILPLIQARRASAREEACDALALAGAGSAARRAYAASLIDALRARVNSTSLPALTFNGTHRSQAMRRLKSILTPPETAGCGKRILVMTTGLSLLFATGFATTAIAFQRGPVPPSARQADRAALEWTVTAAPSQTLAPVHPAHEWTATAASSHTDEAAAPRPVEWTATAPLAPYDQPPAHAAAEWTASGSPTPSVRPTQVSAEWTATGTPTPTPTPTVQPPAHAAAEWTLTVAPS